MRTVFLTAVAAEHSGIQRVVMAFSETLSTSVASKLKWKYGLVQNPAVTRRNIPKKGLNCLLQQFFFEFHINQTYSNICGYTGHQEKNIFISLHMSV